MIMINHRRNYGLVIIIVLFLSGCASTTPTKLTTQYETMGKMLKSIHERGVRVCDQEKLLPAEDCTRIKKIYNDTRKVYLIAGDSLALAIEMQGTEFNQQSQEAYERLSREFGTLMLQWIRLLSEFGLLREGGMK